MKITYNWLKDFVEIKVSARELADKLTMAGLEVVALEEKHGDFIFEIEITSNRPDWLSVIGVAREVAAITNSRLKIKAPLSLQSILNSKQVLKIEIEDKRDCPFYTAKIIRNVKVKPSPDWLKKRLDMVGCRSVNNVVDITNYVLFTWGEPLHAFDLDKLDSDTIMIRRAKKDEIITTIDGSQRKLDSEVLVIANKQKPVAVAGIMGGKDSEVTDQTKNILLEAAIFNPVVVRHGRQKLGIQTESSYRFERGVDWETVKIASREATRLIQEVAGGSLVFAKDSGLVKPKEKKIRLDLTGLDRVLGINIASNKVKAILSNLGFKVKIKDKNRFLVGVPAYRQDVNIEIDLIEEIARIFGYEHIPKTLPAIIPQAETDKTIKIISLLKNLLVGLGLNEVITYTLIDRNLLRAYTPEPLQVIEVLNPLSKEQGILRPTIIPSIAQCIAHNLNQKQDYVNIFEISKIFFFDAKGQMQEELVLGIGLCGVSSWLLEQGRIKEQVGMLHLKGIIENVFERLGIKDYRLSINSDHDEADIYVGEEKIGLLLKLKRDFLSQLDIKNKDAFAAEVSLERLLKYANLKKKFVGLPKYPAIVRDVSFAIREEILVKEMLDVLEEKAGPLLREIKIVDFYKGKHIPAGFKGLTISCLYRSDERTLTEEEINPVSNLIVETLKERFGAQIR